MRVGNTNQPTDGELVVRVLSGDRTASENLFNRHSASAFCEAEEFVQPDRAEDVLHEAIIRAQTSMHSLRDPDRFGRWFLEIVRNVARDLHREVSRDLRLRRSLIESDYLGGARSRKNDDPYKVAATREALTHLKQCVSNLPSGCQSALLLRCYDGMKLREVAITMALPVSTVHDAYQRAVRLLRTQMEEHKP